MSTPAGQQTQPRRSLSLGDAVALIVGIVIGVGIFRAPAIVAGTSANETIFLGLWLVFVCLGTHDRDPDRRDRRHCIRNR